MPASESKSNRSTTLSEGCSEKPRIRRSSLFLEFWALCSIVSLMGSRFPRGVMTLVLAICFVCPIVEMFDQWDHTIQTGNDTEYALVAVALCVGASYAFARVISIFVGRSFSKDDYATDELILTSYGLFPPIAQAATSASPPLTTLPI
jgi:hypothetical protein